MGWVYTNVADVNPGQRRAITITGGFGLVYRAGIILSVLSPTPYRRYGYFSMFYSVGNAGITYVPIQPLGSIWEPVVIYAPPRPLFVNGFVFHRAQDALGSYQIRFFFNDTD